MRLLTLLISVHLWAAVLPLMNDSSAAINTERAAVNWPTHYDGKRLFPIAPTKVDDKFGGRFAGTMRRFTDGERELVFRHLERPTRSLHPAADCYRGSGYRVESAPARRDHNGHLMGCSIVELNGRRTHVCEKVWDTEGRHWYDVSSWFWAATLNKSNGPWWAVTIAEPLTDR